MRRFLISPCRRWLSAIRPSDTLAGGIEVLDAEYAAGVWDYLRGIDELPRFSIVAGYCRHFSPGGSILEIGCGEGILRERLNSSDYSRYVGIDISAEAIRRASPKQDSKTVFISHDASDFSSSEHFDIIVFNESLEYFADPLALVQRYEQFLQPGGRFIVSMFIGRHTVRTDRIWKRLATVYPTRAEAQVWTKPGLSWRIKVYSPRGPTE